MTTADGSVIGRGGDPGKVAVPSTRPEPGPRWRRLRGDARAIGRGLRGEAAAQAERAFLWAPVAFGAGSATYFGLKTEPSLTPAEVVAVGATAVAIAARLWGRSRWLAILAALAAFAAAGFAVAAGKTALVGAPVVPANLGVVTVEGWVADVASPSAERARLLIASTRITRLEPEETPAYVRMVVDKADVLGPGTPIRLSGMLNPPPGPASPGTYDFARDAYFERVGGVGLALKQPQVVDLPEPSWPIRVQMTVNALRWSLARRLASDLQAVMGEEDSSPGLAVAVTTSHEGWLPEAAEQDLRSSGLAHMLAIAGLHTAAVSGFVFAFIRIGVAAWPWLALRVSGKKLAAAGALVAVAAYLLMSGAHPPAKRAAITASVAFAAILFDRRAISLRSLAIAALLILLLQPEAVVQPGFQMSFCATASLVALAEVWPRRSRAINAPWFIRAIQRAKDWLIAMFAVSFVAGSATGPFAIQHFNRVATWGVFANLTADFVASAVLMPAVALSALGEAFGAPPTWLTPMFMVAGWGAKTILSLAHVFSTAPGAGASLPSAPTIALLISFLGILFACLWKGRLRWIGVPLSAAVLLWPRAAPPVGWIAADGNDAAVAVNGRVAVMKPDVRAYASQAWAQRHGLALPADGAAARDKAFDCDRHSCAAQPGLTPALAAWFSIREPKDDRLEALCGSAVIVIDRSGSPPPPACRGRLVLGPDRFARGGSAEIFRGDGGGLRVVWSQPLRGDRPWSRLSDSGG